jgi:hypothetical protein
MKWLATYIGEAPRFEVSSKGLVWEKDETKEVDGETAMLIRASFPELVLLEEVGVGRPPKRQHDAPEAPAGPTSEQGGEG